MLEQSLQILRSIGVVYQRNYFLGMLADCYMSTGQFDAAAKIFRESIDLSEDASGKFYMPEIHRMWGESILAQNGDADEVEQHYIQAIQGAQEQETRLFELRAATSLARLWQKQHKVAEAYERLNSIYSWFTEGFDTPDLQDAKALLTSLS
jgi:adenylate cyclase